MSVNIQRQAMPQERERKKKHHLLTFHLSDHGVQPQPQSKEYTDAPRVHRREEPKRTNKLHPSIFCCAPGVDVWYTQQFCYPAAFDLALTFSLG